jgi:PQQ-dependent dehydrogenase (methanol/ethanol family)
MMLGKRIVCIVLLGSCIGVSMAQQQAAERQENPFAGRPAAIAAGKRLYEQACQSCHGGEGRGGRGPALATGVFRRGSEDDQLFRTIRRGIAGTAMPPFSRLTADQVWQLVSYLRSLSATAGKLNERVAGDPLAGEKLFYGKAACSTCHEVNGRGAIVGPELSAAGLTAAQMLRQKILDPNTRLNPNQPGQWRTAKSLVVKTRNGQEIRGVWRNEDSYSLQMIDRSGKLHLLDKQGLAEQRYEPRSLMPDDYGKRLAEAEIQNLVAYLKTLKGRDLSKTIEAEIPGGLTYERIRHAEAEPHNWLTYWGDYQGRHFSALQQINPANVGQLQARWAVQMPGDSVLEATPLVIDGVMYTTGIPGQVFALDARTGLLIWKYERRQKVVNPYESNRVNRGVAVLGNRLFFGTLDAALVALDCRTGLPLWEVQVADTMKGYSITEAPLAIKDKIVIGVAGGEYGIRGVVDAYDPATGKRLWRFNTIPGPGEFGHDTWAGDSWQRGGGPTWLTGSYDADLDLLYWGVGNPGPDMDAEVRKGDNLFSCSVVALKGATGLRQWHYQFTPNDSHDWDANQDFILTDRVFHGEERKLIMQANRNGMFYVLDRSNGKFLMGEGYVRQSWNNGFDKNGRPRFVQGWDSNPQGSVVYPGLVGGTNWQAPSFDAASGWLYLVFQEAGQRYVRAPSEFEAGKQYWGGKALSLGEAESAGVRAIDSETGAVKWEYKLSQASISAGLLATASGVVFVATREGHLIALEAKTGKFLWRFQTGAAIASSPISYAVDGKQFVAIAAAGVLYSFALPE